MNFSVLPQFVLGHFLGMCHFWLLHFQHSRLLCTKLNVSVVFWNAHHQPLLKGLLHRLPKHFTTLLILKICCLGLEWLNYQGSFYCSLNCA
jgi:endonuclease/exonuclease/phosphatase (EEP) superfamily protein YafD